VHFGYCSNRVLGKGGEEGSCVSDGQPDQATIQKQWEQSCLGKLISKPATKKHY
jgi:hypothetical protein